MRPPPRSTRSRPSSSLSPSTVPLSLPTNAPRPTQADVPIRARHRLRDGSHSRASSSSRGSSVSSSSSSQRGHGRSTIIRIPAGALQTQRQSRSSRRRYEDGGDDQRDRDSDYRPSRSPSLTPPPDLPSAPPAAAAAPGAAPDGSFLEALDNLDYISSLSRPPERYPVGLGEGPESESQRIGSQPFPLDVEDTPSVGSSSASAVERASASATDDRDNDHDGPRYTSQQKGKGRAVMPSPIEVEDSSESDGSFQVISVRGGLGRKRKREGEGESDGVSGPEEREQYAEEADNEVEAEGRALVDEEMGLGSYTCPVCFSQPERAVATLCGHVLCARCLLDSLLAALKRNPNPYPGQARSYRGRPFRGRGYRGRGRGAHYHHHPNNHASSGDHASREPALRGPIEWTSETLRSAWLKHLEIQHLIMDGAPPNVARAVPDDDRKAIVTDVVYFEVIEVLKGLWKVEPGGYVVEGECPVCRKPLPGGFAPPDTGIGGVIPLQMRVGGGGGDGGGGGGGGGGGFGGVGGRVDVSNRT